ncbi:MAG: DUF1385 domain-containing protein [Clostridia bacterium]|nr:DUF1385 domain-containing protein [Clostridia bacterium]
MKKKNKEKISEQEKKIACAKKTSIGGQALMEGIMMRGPKKSAMAVRNPQGEIVLEVTDIAKGKRPFITKIPIARGVYNFVNSMIIGYKALMRSAEISGLEEIEEELAKEKAAKKAAKKAKKEGKLPTEENASAETVAEETVAEETVAEETVAEETVSEEAIVDETVSEEAIAEETVAEEAEAKDADAEDVAAAEEPAVEKSDVKPEKKKSSGLTTAITVIAGVLGVALALVLFIFLPDFLAGLASDPLPNSTVWRPIFAGILKILILIIYMALVCLMKDIRRTFEYHGAEHKTIFCYEAGLELTVENVRKQRRFHPRCGTSFLILMLIVSIGIGLCIDPIYMAITGNPEPTNKLLFSLIKLCLLPITMGIGYELIKLAGRHDNLFTRIISAPGMWLQRLTVKEPTDDMIECAIKAFEAVVPEDNSDKY